MPKPQKPERLDTHQVQQDILATANAEAAKAETEAAQRKDKAREEARLCEWFAMLKNNLAECEESLVEFEARIEDFISDANYAAALRNETVTMKCGSRPGWGAVPSFTPMVNQVLVIEWVKENRAAILAAARTVSIGELEPQLAEFREKHGATLRKYKLPVD